ncbi:MAG: hypothetical protein ACREHG_07385, partial [Candidatus Saccharimonadales bacterium]
MAGLTNTGHPDFQATSGTPVPVLVATIGPFAAGASWGPFTLDVLAGGAYIMEVTPTTVADVMFTDVTVQHLDPQNNVVFEDFYGAVPGGTQAAPNMDLPQPTMIRGNVYGSQLKISGQCGNAAFANAVCSAGGLTASGGSIAVYIIPNGLSDPDPKMSNGSIILPGITGSAPGSLLAVLDFAGLVAGASTQQFVVAPYSGEALLYIRQKGLTTTPANAQWTLQGFTVANGVNPAYQAIYN